MTGKDFDRKIGNALRDYRERPPEELFARIESSLAAGTATPTPIPVPKRKTWPAAVRYAVAAAILAGAIILPTVKLSESDVAGIRIANNTDSATHKTERNDANDIRQVAVEEMLQPEQQVSTNTGYTKKAGTETAIAPEILQPAETAADTSVPETKATEAPALKALPDNTEQKRREDRPARYDYEVRRRADAYWDDLVAQHTAKGKENVPGFSASLYAGNAGLATGDMRTGNPDMALRSGMLITQSYDNGSSQHFGLSDAHGKPAQTPTEPAAPADIDLRHAMPVTVGLSLSIPVAERLAIVTGLNYTYLYSSNTQKSGTENGNVTRELHYLGIPIGVSYTVFRTGGFNFYVQGGGMIEKGIAWKEKISIATTEDSGAETFDRHIRGVQWSVNATAGVSYNFTRHVGLYLEPGVSYYFPSKYQPANYRTENPTNFSLKAGIRFGL